MSFIGKNTAHLRKKLGITQAQLAIALDITQSRIGAWEEFRCEPRINMLVKLADFFNVSIDSLIKEDMSV